MNVENKKKHQYTQIFCTFYPLFAHSNKYTQDMIEAENILICTNGRPDFPELPFDIIIA